MADDGNSHQSIPTGSSHNPTPSGSSYPTPTGSFSPKEYLPITIVKTADSVESSSQTGAGRLKCLAWQHFTKTKVNGEDKARCNNCKKLVGVKGEDKARGTKHLHQHMETCIQLMPKVIKGRQGIVNTTYDPENAKKELVNAIIMHEYPLSIVDHLGFRQYSAALQPLFQVPSQESIKKEILKVYDVERSVALKFLDSHEGRVAVTSNMWTSRNQKRGYMAVTVHYIDSSWTLQSRILRFIYVPAPHTSDSLSSLLLKCLKDWNIDRKLSTITLNNYTTNDSLMDKIKDKLPPSTLLRDGSLLDMHCCAHILNLLVKDGLEILKDVVEKIRDTVVYWTATPKRKEKFVETAEQLCIPYTRCLSLDCPTSWTSTYKMLDIAITYRDVFSRLKLRDSEYTCLPTSSQWEFAEDICGRLKLFNNIAELMSGTKYLTPNIYFPKICEVKLSISKWINSPNEVIQEMAKKMMVNFERYWNVIHDIMGVATVLDPRYKTLLLEFYHAKLYEVDSSVQVERIRQLCYNLFSDYQLKMKKEASSSSPLLDGSNKVDDDDDALSDYDLYITRIKRARTSYKTELDNYLEEVVLRRTPDFDILLWWKLNGVKYPTLQAIAKDVLAIPISAVSSESAFNTGGQILSPHRNRLHWTILEALMCVRSWLRSAVNKGVVTSDSKATQDWSTLLDEMESDNEDGLLVSSTFQMEEDQLSW